MVEELNPKVVGHERTPVEEGNHLHDCESAISTSPEGKAHYGWRVFPSGRELLVAETFLQVMLPEEESDDQSDTKDEKCDDV